MENGNNDYIITDVSGKVRNIKIHPSNGIRALFEAFINSIQSIEEKQIIQEVESPLIEITFIRDENELFDFDDTTEYAIKDVIIKDYGIGFNDLNYNSFKTSESVYKEKRGGKGIGRFFWLKVFEFVKIESVYEQEGSYYFRSFEFRKSKQGIHPIQEPTKLEKPEESYTIVNLYNLDDKYKKHFSRSLIENADLLIQNHISYFIQESCPNVIVYDKLKSKINQINLNKRFNREYILELIDDKFELREEKFIIEILKIKTLTDKPNHNIFYSAHKRSVIQQDISSFIKDIKHNSLNDERFKEPFYISVIVSGKYLDEYVDDARTGFVFPEGEEEQQSSLVLTMREIKNQVKLFIKNQLETYLAKIHKEKITILKDLIDNQLYSYRTLLKHTEYLNDVDTSTEDINKIELDLHKAKNKLTTDIKIKTNEIIDFNNVADPNKKEEYKNDFLKLIQEVNDVGQLSLVDYVVHRKIIIRLFEKALGTSFNEDYEKEAVLHNLIVPMKITSNDIEFEQHNLWLIDEKLVYHNYLASDRPLNNEYFKKGSNRPDILICNDIIIDNPMSLVEEDKAVYDTVVLLEFKKPMIDLDEDPANQLEKYVKQIKAGNAVKSVGDKKGRPLKTSPTCVFYCYLICDISEDLAQNLIDYKGYTSTPDKEKFFKFVGVNSTVKIFYQIMTYDKMLDEAKARNNFFFDKLGLPVDNNLQKK